MSGSGRPDLERLDAHHLRVAVVASSWHDTAMEGLIGGARRALDDCKVESWALVRAPGCFELPVVAKSVVKNGFDAVVALGVVVRGGTPHFDYVCRAVTDGLLRVSLDTCVPVGFGVLTCDTDEQALDRSGLEGSHEDKGYEATHAALSTALTIRGLRNS
jgi:6,7-dimethyl-8-ribityllumazine synthase